MQDAAPGTERFVRREDHRTLLEVALVDDVEEHVRRVGAVREIADLVDHEHVRMRVDCKRLTQASVAARTRQFVDQRGCGDEERIEAVLDGAIRDRDCQVRLAATRLARQDQAATVGDEVGREKRAKKGKTKSRLQREVEIVDRLQKGKPCAAGEPHETCLLAVRDLLGDERGEKVAMAPALFLRARAQIAPDAARVGEVKALEQIIDGNLGRVHEKSSCWAMASASERTPSSR